MANRLREQLACEVDHIRKLEAMLVELDGEARDVTRQRTTDAPPSADLTRPMAYVDALTLARQFLALCEMPEPERASWRGAIAKTGLALAAELERLLAEPYQDGTPIPGAGCI